MSELLQLIIENIPNFVGFALLALVLIRENRRLLEMLEKCIPDDDDDDE